MTASASNFSTMHSIAWLAFDERWQLHRNGRRIRKTMHEMPTFCHVHYFHAFLLCRNDGSHFLGATRLQFPLSISILCTDHIHLRQNHYDFLHRFTILFYFLNNVNNRTILIFNHSGLCQIGCRYIDRI